MNNNLITGYYGMRNYGDDLFSVLTYLGLKKHNLVYSCKIISPRQNNDLNLEYSCFGIFKHGYPYLNKYGTAVRVMNVLYALQNKVDNIFFAGGSLYSSDSFSTADLMYKKKNCNFHAMGVSVGPYKNGTAEKKVIDNLKRYSYISLRDKKSYERVKSYNLDAKIVLASDLAGLGVELIEKKPKKNNTLKHIGFSPCWIDGEKEKTFQYINDFYDQISKLDNTLEYKVIILCLNENPSNGDISLCQEIEKKLLARGINCALVYYSSLGVLGTWYAINDLDFYFTVRLHGAITAYLTETPFYLYEYHEKCTEFLRFIGKEGNNPEVNFDSELLKTTLLPVNDYGHFSKLNLVEHPFYKG